MNDQDQQYKEREWRRHCFESHKIGYSFVDTPYPPHFTDEHKAILLDEYKRIDTRKRIQLEKEEKARREHLAKIAPQQIDDANAAIALAVHTIDENIQLILTRLEDTELTEPYLQEFPNNLANNLNDVAEWLQQQAGRLSR